MLEAYLRQALEAAEIDDLNNVLLNLARVLAFVIESGDISVDGEALADIPARIEEAVHEGDEIDD